MPNTEYKGSKYIALLEELRNLGPRGLLFRSRYELSKKLGIIERNHKAEALSDQQLIEALDLQNPSLQPIQKFYKSGDISLAVKELTNHFKTRKSPAFFFDWRHRDTYQQILENQFADEEADLLEEAEKVCQHKFKIFGSKSVDFGPDVNWHLEPESGCNWPIAHWSKIDIRSTERTGDVKLTWELNRHQFFYILGRAYWFTGDQKYARKFADLLDSWFNANPPEMGINWYSNLEIAIRLISWLWAYNFFLDSPCLDDSLHIRLLKNILQSCRHIEKDFKYSLYSMKNNHVIGDATAIALVGIMFPEFKESRRWIEKYINILNRELSRQVYSDGASFEQAISYHKFVLYFYLLLLRLMKNNKFDVPADFASKIEKMVEFLMYVVKPDGTMPNIGDCDDAVTVVLNNSECSELMPTLSTGAALFQREDFKWVSGDLSEEAFWINGEESVKILENLNESPPVNSSRGFSEGGYYVMRTGFHEDARYLLFKCGPHADHGHADSLHIEMYCSGTSCLRDCGTYAYNGPWEWRTYFRSTKAHNTIVVDGESQSIPHRVFRWLNVAKPKNISWLTSENFDYVDAQHDGYSRYRDPVIHKRAVFFVKPDYWVVVDRIMGNGEHSVEMLFHTPSGDYQENPSGIFRSEDFSIIPVNTDCLDMKVIDSDEEPIQGWFSPSYGVKVPSTSLIYSFAGKLPRIVGTIIDPGFPVISANTINNEQSISIERESLQIQVESEEFIDILAFNWEKNPLASTENLETDGEVAHIRTDKKSDKIIRSALINGSYISFNGKSVLKTENHVNSLDLKLSQTGDMEAKVDPEDEPFRIQPQVVKLRRQQPEG